MLLYKNSVPYKGNLTVEDYIKTETRHSWSVVLSEQAKKFSELKEIKKILKRESDKCKHFNEDIKHDFSALKKLFDDCENSLEYVYYIGFRENGTDHITYINSVLSCRSAFCSLGADKFKLKDRYFSFYKIVMKKQSDIVNVTLFELF